MGGRDAALALAVFACLSAQGARESLEVVRVSRCDAGRSIRFDPDRVERNYRTVAANLEQALSRFEKKALARMENGYDAGLPDPARTVRRTWRPPAPLPELIRGATIYVVTVDRHGKVHGLPEDGRRRNDIVLVSRAARLKDCARLGPVTLLTRDLANRLGLRSSRGRCAVSAEGTEVEILEGDSP